MDTKDQVELAPDDDNELLASRIVAVSTPVAMDKWRDAAVRGARLLLSDYAARLEKLAELDDLQIVRAGQALEDQTRRWNRLFNQVLAGSPVAGVLRSRAQLPAKGSLYQHACEFAAIPIEDRRRMLLQLAEEVRKVVSSDLTLETLLDVVGELQRSIAELPPIPRLT